MKRGEQAVLFSACETLSDDWANGGYVDVLLLCGECGCGSLESWSYSREWLCRVTLQEFKIRY